MRVGGRDGLGVGLGGQGGFERIIEVFVKIKKNLRGGGRSGRGRVGGGGVRVDVNAMLGVEGGMGDVNQV